MRPFLEDEQIAMAKMSNVMAQGHVELQAQQNEIHVFPTGNQINQTGSKK